MQVSKGGRKAAQEQQNEVLASNDESADGRDAGDALSVEGRLGLVFVIVLEATVGGSAMLQDGDLLEAASLVIEIDVRAVCSLCGG